MSCMACSGVSLDVVPGSGAWRGTPARGALDKPMAIACSGDAAPCLPSRMWCISSRTNSPACVLGDLPCLRSCSARLMVSLSGMSISSADSEEPACNQRAALRGERLHSRSPTARRGAREKYLRSNGKKCRASPAPEPLPGVCHLAAAKDLVLPMLRGSRAGMVGQDAKPRADREALEVDRAPVAARDNAVLLVRLGDDQVGDRLAGGIADHAVTLVDPLAGGAAAARKRHPSRVGEDPVLVALGAEHGG